MDVSASDVKFVLSYFGALVLLWRASSWVTRKQVIVENFLDDTRSFMQTTASAMHRIETNHLVHIQAALTGGREFVEVVAQNKPLEDIHDAVQES